MSNLGIGTLRRKHSSLIHPDCDHERRHEADDIAEAASTFAWWWVSRTARPVSAMARAAYDRPNRKGAGRSPYSAASQPAAIEVSATAP
jgi:hypothetical protein